MPKKVTDIFPPQKKEKEKRLIVEKTPSPGLKIFVGKKKAPHFKKALIFSLFFLVLLGAFSYFTLSRAKIEIWPETEFLALEKELTVDWEAKENNFLSGVVPGHILEKEKIIIESFPSSGKILKEERAEGTIKVYNDYSALPQTLVAATRFVSSDGKIFRTPSSVIIPGGTYLGGKFVSGEMDVRVVADQPGPEYNIGPSSFSIPGFAGTDRYTKFYGKSFQPMSGGFSEEVSRVTEEDILRAEEYLTKKGKKECQEALRDELRSESVLLNFNYISGESEVEIIEKISLVDAGEEAKDFNFKVKSRCKTLLFAKKDLDDLVKELIAYHLPEKESFPEDDSFLASPAETLIYQESLKVNYSPKQVDLISGKMILLLNVQAKTYPEINLQNLKNALVGKSSLEAKIFLESQSRVARVDVNFWPFWVRRVPENLNKIEAEIKVDP